MLGTTRGLVGETIPAEELTANRIYDPYAPTYGFNTNANKTQKLKAELVLKHLKPTDDVLDIGCANGIHLRFFGPKCRSIVGVDISDPMLAIAREAECSNVTVRKAGASSLPFNDSAFDLVYSFSTLPLVPNIELAMCELVRVLKPGGFAVLDLLGLLNLSHVYWDLYFKRQGHFGQHGFTCRGAVKLIERHGLEVIESHAAGFLDQWRYIPGVHLLKSLDRIVHRSLDDDLDYSLSRYFRPFAGRWFFIARKRITDPSIKQSTD
jgi:ubiquinone/menaquinone biosynthesis C-methylase UbiE